MEGVDAFLVKQGITAAATKSGTYWLQDYDGAALTANQKEFYNELIETVVNPALNYVDTQRAVKKIRSRVLAKLSEQEAEVLLYGIAVAQYSMEYWYENAAKWRTAGNLDAFAYRAMTKGNNPEDDDSLDWKEVAKGDVSGVVGGTAAGALAGGVGAGPGALAGGLAGFVTAGVGKLWDYIFG